MLQTNMEEKKEGIIDIKDFSPDVIEAMLKFMYTSTVPSNERHIAEILKASGKKVYKTQIINDRGIHICKSMLAWQKFSNGATPESANMKGDKLVGKYYVEFDNVYKTEIADLVASGMDEDPNPGTCAQQTNRTRFGS